MSRNSGGRPFGSINLVGSDGGLYGRRRARGLCGRCGRQPEPGSTLCAYDRAKQDDSIRKRRIDNPGHCRDYHLRKKYGIGLAKWTEMFSAQGGCCAICGTKDPVHRRGWHVDHDHETGSIRAILCGKCNSGIGMFGDSLKTILMAADYLVKHNHDRRAA